MLYIQIKISPKLNYHCFINKISLWNAGFVEKIYVVNLLFTRGAFVVYKKFTRKTGAGSGTDAANDIDEKVRIAMHCLRHRS